jgi:nucleotide sugar dehydrogenase
MKIAIAGTGYVGFVTAVCFADKGHEVVCVDVDQEKIDKLNREGKPLIYEQDLAELMTKNSTRLSYTTDYKAAYAKADAIFIGVGTPERRDGSANLSYVYQVAQQIAESVEQDCAVVVKSTVPIGTNEKVEKILNENKRPEVNLYVVSNPEFLAQGTAVRDTLHASRVVIGVEDERAKEIMLRLYANFDAPKIITNRRSAEMTKYASNDFLALKISYINEIANLCEMIGADINAVTEGMGYDDRIGKRFLQAGIGYGGSCFPKDTKALLWLSNFHDHELKTVKAAIEVNENQKLKLIKKARKYYASFAGLTVAVLGLTFKPGTDDLREAASLLNVPILLEDGAKVKVYDPVGRRSFRRKFGEQVTYCKNVNEALQDADLCFVFTEWPEIKACQAETFKERMKQPIIIDGRNCYALEDMKDKGVIYESIGRSTIS